MAKGLKVSGRMSVGRFEKEFEEEFGVKCQIKKGRKLADDAATLASLRSDDFKGSKTVDFTIRGNMLIKNIKKKFTETFGSNIQFYYKNRVAPEDITIGALQRGEIEKIDNSLQSKNLEQKEDVGFDDENTIDSEIKDELNEFDLPAGKFLENNCEYSEGVGCKCTIKPVKNYEEIINFFNSVYHDYVYDKLFNYKVYDDEIVLWGTTYLVRFNGEELGIDDIYELPEEDFFKKLKENNVPEALHELILLEEGQITVGAIIKKILMKPGTKAELEITDQEYGNDKIDLES